MFFPLDLGVAFRNGIVLVVRNIAHIIAGS